MRQGGRFPVSRAVAPLAFVHTSRVHIDTFDALVRAAQPQQEVMHVVAEALLSDAQRLGAHDPGIVARVQHTLQGAAAMGARLVVCTCSTIGGAAERTPTGGRFHVQRIDRAMADGAVRLGPRVRIVAALPSTVAPTTALLQESAAAQGRALAAQVQLVPEAWAHFQAGDRAAYLAAVAQAVRSDTTPVDAIVLAQASMAGAADLLGDLTVPVLASPHLGVEAALRQLAA